MDLLDAITAVDAGLGIVTGQCPACRESFEAQPHRDGLRLGYTYFGGALHFEATSALVVRGLAVDSPRPDELVLTLGERTWRFAARTDKTEWMAILRGSASEGRAITELHLDELEVRIIAFERPRYHPAPFAPDTVLKEGDRLLVVGRPSALRRAWARIHQGP